MQAEAKLPDSVAEIARVIGRDQALYLIGQLPPCGSRPWRVAVYVPKRLPPDHRLVVLLGYRDAMAMSRHFGGEILQPSNLRFLERRWRNNHIRNLRRQGRTAREIADEIEVNIETVKKVLQGKLQGNPPQDREVAHG